MLRVGLTGELGSGKSTVGRLLAGYGAVVLSSDEMGRALMQPGEAVFAQIVQCFGRGVLLPDGTLNRPELARLAFDPERPRAEELNAIVHPAVIAEQERRIAAIRATQPEAIVVVESALIFTTRHAGGAEPWRSRFDAVVLVTAPEETKVRRFIERMSAHREISAEEKEVLARDARQRLAAQRIPEQAARQCLQVINDGDLANLERRVYELWLGLIHNADLPAPSTDAAPDGTAGPLR